MTSRQQLRHGLVPAPVQDTLEWLLKNEDFPTARSLAKAVFRHLPRPSAVPFCVRGDYSRCTNTMLYAQTRQPVPEYSMYSAVRSATARPRYRSTVRSARSTPDVSPPAVAMFGAPSTNRRPRLS
jgi:hypothetical protein